MAVGLMCLALGSLILITLLTLAIVTAIKDILNALERIVKVMFEAFLKLIEMIGRGVVATVSALVMVIMALGFFIGRESKRRKK